MAEPALPPQTSTLPRFYVGGQEKGDLARDVRNVEIVETTEGMKQLRLSLTGVGPRAGSSDETLLYLDGALLDFGTELKVALGPETALVTVFEGHVTSIELIMVQGTEPEVRVHAEDKLVELRTTRRFKTYTNATDADVLRQIAGLHGLSGNANADGPSYAEIQQWNQSDLAFLRDRARRLAADVWVDDQSTLHMATRGNRNGNQLTLIQGNDLLALEARADLAQQRTSVKVGGFDAKEQDSIDHEAAANVVAAEVTSGKHGPSVLSQAFGDRVSYRVRDVPLEDAQATSLANAELLRRARRFVTLHGVTLGTPQMTVGSLIRLNRVAPVFAGDGYYVTEVRHRFDAESGLRTVFDAERAWIGNPA